METIQCPNCKKHIALIVRLPNILMVSALCKYPDGELYQPRERWEIESSKIEETKEFIFREWKNIVLMRFYDLDGKLIKEYRKDSLKN